MKKQKNVVKAITEPLRGYGVGDDKILKILGNLSEEGII